MQYRCVKEPVQFLLRIFNPLLFRPTTLLTHHYNFRKFFNTNIASEFQFKNLTSREERCCCETAAITPPLHEDTVFGKGRKNKKWEGGKENKKLFASSKLWKKCSWAVTLDTVFDRYQKEPRLLLFLSTNSVYLFLFQVIQ